MAAAAAGSSLAAAAAAGSLSDHGGVTGYGVGGGGKPGDSSSLRRTPSTSAIYETLRRSKELRESLSSRPSSRLSIDNNMLASSGYRDAVRITFISLDVTDILIFFNSLLARSLNHVMVTATCWLFFHSDLS